MAPATVREQEALQYNQTTTPQRPYRVGYKTHQGRRHMVLPVIMMVEGVHCGSAGPVFHSASELARYPESWNGIPVVIGHPETNGENVSANSPDIIDSQVVGRVYNARYDGKLKGEVWLDEARLNIVDASLVAHLKAGRPLDVSIGAYTDDETVSGTWNGEAYALMSHNYRPDHLALLPAAMGACSWEDGCGIRTNAADRGDGGDGMNKQLWLGMLGAGYQMVPLQDNALQSNQLGYREVTRLIQDKLNTRDNSERTYYLEEVYDDEFIFRVETAGKRALFRNGYTISEAGVLEIGNGPVEVSRRVEYTDVGQAQVLQKTTSTFVRTKPVEEKPMNTNKTKPVGTACPKVEQLIQLNHFDADDKEWLSGLEESAIDRLLVVHGAIAKPVEKKEEKKAPEVTEPQANAETPQMNEEQVLAALSPERRQQMEHGMKLYREHREGLVGRITANSKVYSAEELAAMDTTALEKLAQVVKPVANYAIGGAGTAPQANQGEAPLLPPGVKVSEGK